nr:PREDICTED: immunoglobulin superfamily DCC subclass member 3-like [Latimeria chalumnae]|eukprot:XP_014346444.1 PREDICTED: immunoglobulin superfamily DCC subclass member 3-like [Latimeria chalumnae]
MMFGLKTLLATTLLMFALDLTRASELAFLVEPADVIAVRDRPLVLNCQVEGEEPIVITWRKNGVPLQHAPHTRTRLLTNGSLLFENFHKKRSDNNETDVGEYDCAAHNRYGLLVSRKAKIQLASLPKFLAHPESMTVEEGGVARFQCLIRGIPEAVITWECNRTALQTEDQRYTLLPSGILQITGVQRSDVGFYRCVATNIANTRYSQEAQLKIMVSVPKTYKEPVILSGPQNLTVSVHQTAILECIATGNPRPIVSWSRLDGRSIGVEGIQVLGTGNLMISDVSVQHSGIYVCAANRPGTRVRRTAQGMLVVQAPPEFTQWPQSMSKPVGSRGVMTCVAQGVPEPHLIWLKNGKILTPGENVKLSQNNRFNTGIKFFGEPESRELQEAVSKTTFQHDFTNLEPSTTYSIYLKAYSPLGASKESQVIVATTLGSVPAAPGFFTKVINATAIHVFWELPQKHGKIEGFKLYHRKLPGTVYEGPRLLPSTANSFVFNHLEPSALYEIKLQAFNGNGDGNGTVRFISLKDTIGKIGGDPVCQCQQDSESSLTGIVVGVHIGMACIIFCVLFLMFGYRKR